jgi:hypothetical protein
LRSTRARREVPGHGAVRHRCRVMSGVSSSGRWVTGYPGRAYRLVLLKEVEPTNGSAFDAAAVMVRAGPTTDARPLACPASTAMSPNDERSERILR